MRINITSHKITYCGVTATPHEKKNHLIVSVLAVVEV